MTSLGVFGDDVDVLATSRPGQVGGRKDGAEQQEDPGEVDGVEVSDAASQNGWSMMDLIRKWMLW